jgi:PAS domain S-box-containing protein
MPLADDRKYRTLIETAPDAIFLVDMDSGRILEVNERAEELLGYSAEELVDKPIETIHPSEETDRYREKFAETVSEGSIQFSKFEDGTQIYLCAKDGKRIPVDICAKVIDPKNDPVLFGVARDISEMKAYEEEIERLAGELAVVNRVIRHDIRNDMAVISGWLDQLHTKIEDPPEALFERLQRKSQSVIQLTDTVKDYVEMIEGDAEATLESVLINNMVETEIAAIEQAYEDVTVDVEEMPTQPVVANSLLASVFRNLFHNAVQHNDKEIPEIEVHVEDRAETIVIHVADNGPGISEARRATIFGKGNKGLESSGTGIGLYLIGELTDIFGGDVWISDNEPEGTVFSVELRKAT